MASWLFKTAVQRGISVLPASHWWNGLLQQHVTHGFEIQAYGEFQSKVKACQRHFDFYRQYSTCPQKDFTVLEVGTGWFPILPIGLYLCGARELWTFDIVRLLRPDTFQSVIDHFCFFSRSGEIYSILPAACPERVANFLKLACAVRSLPPVEFLARLNIHALIQDVCYSGLPEECIDLVFSHGVLEHFQPQPLASALAEFRRVCKKTSIMSHYLGIADQFSAYDRSITPFNYLRYSARAWRLLNNPMIPQNRLRISDYRHAVESASFEIAAEEDIRGEERDLAAVPLAGEFKGYSKQDLLVLFSWLVSRPA